LQAWQLLEIDLASVPFGHARALWFPTSQRDLMPVLSAGWVLFLVFAGWGMFAAPIDWLFQYMRRPKAVITKSEFIDRARGLAQRAKEIKVGAQLMNLRPVLLSHLSACSGLVKFCDTEAFKMPSYMVVSTAEAPKRHSQHLWSAALHFQITGSGLAVMAALLKLPSIQWLRCRPLDT
jgi:hypothetical protein